MPPNSDLPLPLCDSVNRNSAEFCPPLSNPMLEDRPPLQGKSAYLSKQTALESFFLALSVNLLYHLFFVSQILFVWLITSLLYSYLDLVVAFLVDFCLLTWLFIFYLGYFVCHLVLLCSFSDNFVCCLSQLDQGHYFAFIIYLIITSYHSTTYHLR
jgi:hypothetical protein